MKVPELLAEPWAIAGPAYDAIVQTAREGGSFGDAKAAALGVAPEALIRLLEMSPESELDVRGDGIAVIPVSGYLTRRPYWRGDRASYEWIGARVQEAADRADVRGIVLEVDTRGGQVNGTEELASLIRGVRAERPISAFVLGQASSAGYWIASAASRVVVGRTSMVGSVGVIWTFIDWSKYDAEHGIQEITIVSSQSPDKALDPATKHGRDRVQATCDQLAGVFVADVAANRRVSEETVVADFGQGWVLVGEEAVTAGMADRVGTFEDAITEVSDLENDFGTTTPAAAGEEENVTTIDIKNITAEWMQANLPNVFASMQATAREGFVAQAEHDGALASLRADATKWAEAALSAAVAREGERCAGIDEAARGTGVSQKLVTECKGDPSVSIEAAKARFFEAMQAKRKGNLDALAEDSTDVDDVDPDDGNEDDAAAHVASVKAAGDYVQKAGLIR